ncbi:MAG TPA: phosphatase PAP2 family protein [Vicinamibacterales bacterium]|nr:phosphatase PAP2 family protein [Vicinamibacterales bacterium]
MSLALFLVVSALLVTWAFLRRRRIETTTGGSAVLSTAGGVESAPLRWPRPTLAQLGLNSLGRRLLALDAAVLVIDVLLFSRAGLTLEWSTVWFGELILSTLIVAWLNFYFLPGEPREWFVAEVIWVTFLLVLVTNVASPLQYGTVAVKSPYIDPWLSAADARMGVEVEVLAAWTRAHPAISVVATVVYNTFQAQLVLAIFILAALRERERLWEFAFHFHVCLIVTVSALVIWPALGPAAYHGFAPTVDMTRLVEQVKGFHEGTMTVVRFDDLQGLVSFPSFHVAGALIVTWAFRSRRGFFIPLLALNGGLVISTFITGVHYVVDVLAAVPLLVGSLAAYRWWGRLALTRVDGLSARPAGQTRSEHQLISG